MPAPTYAEILLTRHTLRNGEVGGMVFHDVFAALQEKVKGQGLDSLGEAERLFHALGQLDGQAGSDEEFEGYFRSNDADDWRIALEGLGTIGLEGYRAIALRAAGVFGGEVPATRKARIAALKALDDKGSILLEQLSNLWWEFSILNAADEKSITRLSETDPRGPLADPPAPPPREECIDVRLVRYFVERVGEFNLKLTPRDAARLAATQSATRAAESAGSPAQALLEFCATPNPWVYGRPCDKGKPKRFPVFHLVGEGANARALKTLRTRLGDVAAGPEAFYSQVNGALLMREADNIADIAFPKRLDTPLLTDYISQAWSDQVSGSAGFALYPIELWEESTKDMLTWFESIEEEDFEEVDFTWLEHATSIGQVIHSADHFVLVSGGPLAGKVLFTDHETLEGDVFAESFEEFIALIAGAPSWFLQKVLSDWRFTDAKGAQWVPEAWMEERILSKP